MNNEQIQTLEAIGDYIIAVIEYEVARCEAQLWHREQMAESVTALRIEELRRRADVSNGGAS